MSWGNARAYLDRVGVLLEHDPDVRTVRESRLDILNRHYEEISESHPWRFLQVEADLFVWRQRTYVQPGNLTATMTANEHIVTFSGTLGVDFTARAAGLVFSDGAGRTSTIGAWIGTTIAYLVDAYAGPSGANTTWSIATDKVILPQDCAEPLGFIDRANGRGRLVSLDRRREELYLSWDSSATGDVTWLVDGDAVYLRAPDPTIAVAADATAGTLTANSIMEYCYTFVYEGQETAPSIIVSATTGTGATRRMLLTGIEDTRDGVLATRKQKNLYRRQVTNNGVTVNGRWLRLATLTDATTTYTDDGSVLPSLDDSLALHYTGPRRYIRPRVIPGADATLRIRYLQKPRRLVADSDVIMGPQRLADAVCYRAAADIAGTASERAKAGDWEGKAARILAGLMKVEMKTADTPSRRMPWGGSGSAGVVRAGTVTSNYGS